jgi:hypothetical protein
MLFLLPTSIWVMTKVAITKTIFCFHHLFFNLTQTFANYERVILKGHSLNFHLPIFHFSKVILVSKIYEQWAAWLQCLQVTTCHWRLLFQLLMLVFVMCMVQGPLTIWDLGFNIWESRCHLTFIVQFWNNKLDSKMFYHVRFNIKICRLWSWYVACDGKSQLSIQLGELKCCNCTTTTTMNNVCASWFITNKISIDFQFFRKLIFFPWNLHCATWVLHYAIMLNSKIQCALCTM